MSYSSEVLADSPVGYWHLDQASGNAPDSSGGGHTLNAAGGGIVYSEPALINAGTSVRFTGGQTFRQLSTVAGINANGKVTIEGWVKTTSGGASVMQVICADDNGGPRYFQFRVNSGLPEVILFDSSNNPHSLIATHTINDGNPHYLVGTYDGATIKLYIDGLLEAATASVFTLNTSNPKLCIAERNTGGTDSDFWVGTLDEIALYTTDLSLARIQAHYVAGGGTIASSSAIKTVEGLAKASIKTVMGVPIASVKTIEGLA